VLQDESQGGVHGSSHPRLISQSCEATEADPTVVLCRRQQDERLVHEGLADQSVERGGLAEGVVHGQRKVSWRRPTIAGDRTKQIGC
jgi:hypothetical protein